MKQNSLPEWEKIDLAMTLEFVDLLPVLPAEVEKMVPTWEQIKMSRARGLPRHFAVDGTPFPATHDQKEWVAQLEEVYRQAAQFRLHSRPFWRHGVAIEVSTVLLTAVIEWGDRPPLMFETMIFTGNGFLDFQVRYLTADAARQGHYKIVNALHVAQRARSRARFGPSAREKAYA